MKPKPQDKEKKLSNDLNTFDALPNKTKEYLQLGEESAKLTGEAQASVDREIILQSEISNNKTQKKKK